MLYFIVVLFSVSQNILIRIINDLYEKLFIYDLFKMIYNAKFIFMCIIY